MKIIHFSLFFFFFTFDLFSQNKFEKNSIIEIMEFKQEIIITKSTSINSTNEKNMLIIENKIIESQELSIFEILLTIEKSEELKESKSDLKIHSPSIYNDNSQNSIRELQHLPEVKTLKKIDFLIER